jgi:3-oxoacyl-[acyl-carrier-protein] synthase-3
LSIFRPIRILGTGKCLPGRKVSSEGLDARFDRPRGWIRKKTQIECRHVAGESETSVFMATHAIQEALSAGECPARELDLIISASSMAEQPIPCNAALIQKALGLEQSGIPCFDVNSTCLSFVTAMDVASGFIVSGQYNRVAVVSSEIASKGVNWADVEGGALFGDGAAAVILGPADAASQSGILATAMSTFSSGSAFCQIKAGGTRFNPQTPPERLEDYLFQMDGRSVYKLAAEKLPWFVSDLLDRAGMALEQIDVFIPHQASALALRHLHMRLGIPTARLVQILSTHGNQVAASIPTAFHEAVRGGRLERGKIAMLIGTAAGLSLGGIILRY